MAPGSRAPAKIEEISSTCVWCCEAICKRRTEPKNGLRCTMTSTHAFTSASMAVNRHPTSPNGGNLQAATFPPQDLKITVSQNFGPPTSPKRELRRPPWKDRLGHRAKRLSSCRSHLSEPISGDRILVWMPSSAASKNCSPKLFGFDVAHLSLPYVDKKRSCSSLKSFFLSALAVTPHNARSSWKTRSQALRNSEDVTSDMSEVLDLRSPCAACNFS